ncbi:transposase [Proteiniclasticum sp. QWL-01]|uniref:transposase n=1 Tax=Proteiniclasticum sp. QWL-01 TaxID=3036945 RepID=UPI0024117485|nr:transposase [Proteiniclasticum sp. QWL-01]WFF73106.1 transposase [Proteiniclasticum sp. QWL-01]
MEGTKKTIRSVKFEKAENDALFDGYFSAITNEMDYDASMIREVYSGPWRIEESFPIIKSDLEARSVYVNTQEHIQAQFLIGFVALLMVRVIQNAMGKDALSVERIARALNAATCKVKQGGIVELDDIGGSQCFV